MKIRIGFGDGAKFEQIVGVLGQHDLSHVTVHAHTVHDLHRQSIHFECVKLAETVLGYKSVAHRELNSAQHGCDVIGQTDCDGMILG